MKPATCIFLGVLSVAAGAAEPARSPPAKSEAATEWKLDYELKFDKNVYKKIAGAMVIAAPANCYYMRMTRPLPDATDAGPQSPRFIPLQSRVTGVVSESVCTSGGQILRAVR